MTFHDPVTWVIAIFGIFVLQAIIRNLITPPRKVQWLEVPEELRREAELALPDFVVESVIYSPVAKSYRAKGTYRENAGRLEIECNGEGGVREIEYEEEWGRVVNGKESCGISDLPAAAMEHLNQLLGTDAAGFRPGFITCGKTQDEEVFEVKGRSSRWKWEIEITATGRLIELEKEVLRR